MRERKGEQKEEGEEGEIKWNVFGLMLEYEGRRRAG